MVHIIAFGPNGTRVEYDREFPGGIQYAAEHCRQQVEQFAYHGEGYFIYDNRGEWFAIVERGIYFLCGNLGNGRWMNYGK